MVADNRAYGEVAGTCLRANHLIEEVRMQLRGTERIFATA
jgi:hypothetical protein